MSLKWLRFKNGLSESSELSVSDSTSLCKKGNVVSLKWLPFQF